MANTRASQGCELTFKNICVKTDKKVILKDVNGFAKPGELLAVMGASGAGKTTLLNCLAGRTSIDSGQILMDSTSINKQLRRKISYVLQQDIFKANLTCWQTIWYTALLRLPGSMPTKYKKEIVYDIIDGLDMRKCLHTVIGDNTQKGVSGGEKKRTSIACELLTNPQLMLLDEPTSGLDSSTAFSLCSTLKSYAKKSGKTVVISIHQPSSRIFNMFDRLLLLCDGQTVFHGDIDSCAQHFIDIGLPCPINYNLADHILSQLQDSEETKEKVMEHSQKFRDVAPIMESQSSDDEPRASHERYPAGISSLTKSLVEESDVQLDASGSATSNDSDKNNDVGYDGEHNSKWPTSFSLQYTVLARRYFRQSWPIQLSKWNLLQVLLIVIFSTILWFQIEPVEEEIQNRLGLIYFLLIQIGFTTILNAAMTFPPEWLTLNKERLSGYYRLSAYYLAKVSVDIPLFMVGPLLCNTIVYWTSGLNYNFWVFLQFLLTSCLSAITAYSIATLYGALLVDVNILVMIVSTTMVILTLASGYFVINIPAWAVWIKYGAFLTHSASALLMIDFDNSPIMCSQGESRYKSCHNITSPTTNSSQHFISRHDLLIKHTVAEVGLELWHCLTILACISLLMHVFAYISLRFIRKPHLA